MGVAIPQEKVWRGGAWSRRQKLSFVRKAFGQLIQRLRALQDEWDEFEKTINDEELGMIIRTLALLLGDDGLWRKGERKRSPSTWVVHAVHYEVSRRIKMSHF